MTEKIMRNVSGIYFVKTSEHIELDDANIEHIKSVFVPDADMEAFPIESENELSNEVRIFPLAVDSYPRVLSSNTASQAGEWALRKCANVGWEGNLQNVRSCLANLEMDF